MEKAQRGFKVVGLVQQLTIDDTTGETRSVLEGLSGNLGKGMFLQNKWQSHSLPLSLLPFFPPFVFSFLPTFLFSLSSFSLFLSLSFSLFLSHNLYDACRLGEFPQCIASPFFISKLNNKYSE